jgi:FkbM family methyltransferase
MTDPKALSVKLDIGTWSAALGLLIQRGLRLGSYIDIGCADSYFALAFWRAGPFRDVSIINIDANPLYEPTLRKIRDAIGGDYRICAVDERTGSIELHASAHPYWASAAPPDDPYWATIHGQLGQTITVPCRTLDSIVDELAPRPPYAIKLDIQGLEARALRSGPRALDPHGRSSSARCWSTVSRRSTRLEQAGFALYDLTDSYRTPDHTLGWFYATYLHRDYDSFRTAQHWPEAYNEAMVGQQERDARTCSRGSTSWFRASRPSARVDPARR